MPGPTGPVHDYPDYPPDPARRSPWLWIFLAIAVVVILVLSVVLITQQRDTTTAAPQSPSQTAPQPSQQQPKPNNTAGLSTTCEGFTASVDAKSQPGWHATINKYGLAYAVPPDWAVTACGVRMGWAQPCPDGQCIVRDVSAATAVANPACTKQNLALAGVTGSKNPDVKAALDEETSTVPTIYTRNGQAPPKVDFTPVREFSIGGHPAVQTVATVTGMAPDACNGSSALHSIVVTTVPHVEGSVVFLISLRQGANATPKADVINKIVATLRSPA